MNETTELKRLNSDLTLNNLKSDMVTKLHEFIEGNKNEFIEAARKRLLFEENMKCNH